MFIGCSDAKDERTILTESDIVGKRKLTFRDGYGNDAGYVIYEFNKNGTGLATEFDGGGIDSEKKINKWYLDTDRGVIVCVYKSRYDGHSVPMELLIAEYKDKDHMKWIWIGEDNDTAYPVVRIAH